MRRLLLLALLLAFPLRLYIEAQSRTDVPLTETKLIPNAVTTQANTVDKVYWGGKQIAPPATPAPLTEVESLRVQNANLERVIVQRAIDDFQKKLATLKADLERARPGWDWNPETGAWQRTPPKDPAK